MKKPGKGKEKKKIGYNYLGMAGIAVIALVLLGSLMVQSKTLQQRLDNLLQPVFSFQIPHSFP